MANKSIAMLFSYEKNSVKTDIALLLLRLAAGGIMLFSHGWKKAVKLFTQDPIQFAEPLGMSAELSLGLAVFAEVICAGLLVIGFMTRWVSIPLIVTMLVAAFVIHLDDPFGDKEFAILYLVPYIVFLLTGGGRFSLDAAFQNNNKW